MSRAKKRRRYLHPEQKASILREHLVDKAPVSALCEKHELLSSGFHQTRTQLLNGAETSLQTRRGKYSRGALELVRPAPLPLRALLRSS